LLAAGSHAPGKQIALLRTAPVRYDRAMDHDDAPCPTPPGWLEALERSEADVAAGRTVTWQEARARLLAMLAEMEVEQARRGA
jgi:hypothetical protein